MPLSIFHPSTSALVLGTPFNAAASGGLFNTDSWGVGFVWYPSYGWLREAERRAGLEDVQPILVKEICSGGGQRGGGWKCREVEVVVFG